MISPCTCARSPKGVGENGTALRDMFSDLGDAKPGRVGTKHHSPMIVPARSAASPRLRMYGVFQRLLRLSYDACILTLPFDGLAFTSWQYQEPVAQLVEQRTFNP